MHKQQLRERKEKTRMSFIPNGGSSIFIGNDTTQTWIFTWFFLGWSNDTFIQPQPLNTGASMSYTDPSVSMNSGGEYSFTFSVTNDGPNTTFYNLQVANV
jgi:hypothetical protein